MNCWNYFSKYEHLEKVATLFQKISGFILWTWCTVNPYLGSLDMHRLEASMGEAAGSSDSRYLWAAQAVPCAGHLRTPPRRRGQRGDTAANNREPSKKCTSTACPRQAAASVRFSRKSGGNCQRESATKPHYSVWLGTLFCIPILRYKFQRCS